MAAREYPNNTKEADVERSAKDIRRDIAEKEENISKTVDQIGKRINEKLDWREYVKSSPYWAMGAATGLGYLASRMFLTRSTPMERIMDSIAKEVRDSLGGPLVRAAGSGLIKMTLMGIATKAAVSWIKNATSTDVASGFAGSQPQTGPVSPKVDT
jgi:ElaB/YqjD/DUF883 family membrane-anchored ribosome-binding protein